MSIKKIFCKNIKTYPLAKKNETNAFIEAESSSKVAMKLLRLKMNLNHQLYLYPVEQVTQNLDLQKSILLTLLIEF